MNKLFPTKPVLTTKSKAIPKGKGGKKRKAKIPAAVYEAIWIQKMGRVFEGKCLVPWCPNTINVFDFQAGHNIPESKGGPANVENLFPICARCNQSMGDRYTLDEWNAMSPPVVQPLPPLPLVPIVPPKQSWWCC
jgi:5-methylcytosine-specific restriction endonuclease McrA